MRANRLLLLLLAAGLAACQQSAQAPATGTSGSGPPPRAAPPAPQVPPAAPVASLAGAWRVASIDGSPLGEPYRLDLAGDADRLWWEPRCAGVVRSYRIAGSSIAFRPLGSPLPPVSPPPPVCAIGLPPRLAEIMRALDAATDVARTADEAILIAGGGRSVTLVAR